MRISMLVDRMTVAELRDELDTFDSDSYVGFAQGNGDVVLAIQGCTEAEGMVVLLGAVPLNLCDDD